MTGATEPRPPIDSDFDANTALDEAEEASPSLELDLDETPAEPGPLARGADIVKSFWRHAPHGPGVYRMIGAGATAEVVPEYTHQAPQMLNTPVDERYCITVVRSTAP